MSDFKIVKLIDPIQLVNIIGGLVPRGAYNALTDYAVGDSVDYNGSSYVMFNDAVAGTLPTDTTYWQVVVNKGDQGIQGEQGPQGIQGENGVGVVAGGTAGQVLAKIDETDYNTEWVDPSAGTGTVDSVVAGTNINVDSTDPANPIVNLNDSITVKDSCIYNSVFTATNEAEKVSNGTFNTDLTDWTIDLGTASIVDGRARIEDDGSGSKISQTITGLEVGKEYLLTVNSYWVSGDLCRTVQLEGQSTWSWNTTNDHLFTQTFTATATSLLLELSTDGVVSIMEFDNVSIKKTLSNSGGGSVEFVIPKTYAELQAMVAVSQLVLGQKYLLTDYYTMYQQPISLTVKVGTGDFGTANPADYYEEIILTASGDGTFESTAVSSTYLGNILEYSFSDVTTHSDGIECLNRHGYILRRTDTVANISLPFDYKQTLFARYKLDYTGTGVNIGVPTSIVQWEFYSEAVYPSTVYVCIKAMDIGDFVDFTDLDYFRPIYGELATVSGNIFWNNHDVATGVKTFSFVIDTTSHTEYQAIPNTASNVYVESGYNFVVLSSMSKSKIIAEFKDSTLNGLSDNSSIYRIESVIGTDLNWTICYETIGNIYSVGAMSDNLFKGYSNCLMYDNSYFEYNNWIVKYFRENIVGGSFNKNYGKGDAEGNVFGDGFQGNELGAELSDNTFGSNFTNALVPSGLSNTVFADNIDGYGTANKDLVGVYYIDNTGTKNYLDQASATTLDALTDVTITTPVAGNHLEYNGSVWVNKLPEQLYKTVRNETGVSIAIFKAVYVSGFNNFPLVGLADNTDINKHHIIGITKASIAHEANGVVVTTGVLSGVDTNAFSVVGAKLYLGTAGTIVEGYPTSGEVIFIGEVMVKDNNGSVLLYAESGCDYIASASAQDVHVRMGDSSGTNKVIFENYADSEVASLDSLGNLDVANMGTANGFATLDADALLPKAQLTYHNHNSGFEDIPVSTEGTGTYTVGANECWFYDDATRDTMTLHTISASGTFTPTDPVTGDSAVTYCCADRDTDTWVSLSYLPTQSDIRYEPAFKVVKRNTSSNLHHQAIYRMSHGDLEATYDCEMDTNQYKVAPDALRSMNVSGSLAITLTGGNVWIVGKRKYDLLDVTTATRLFKCYQTTVGTWSISSALAPTLNNTQWNDVGVGLDTIPEDEWAEAWVWRGVEDQDHFYYVYGTRTYATSALAQANNVIPDIPILISSHAVFVGRIIFQETQTTGFIYESAFTTIFGASTAITSHNSLTGRTTADAHPASAITNTPSGTIGATTVQGAIDELGTEKADKNSDFYFSADCRLTYQAGIGLVCQFDTGGGNWADNSSVVASLAP